MRGIVQLPESKGLKEITWYIGRASVAGGNEEAPVVAMRINRDADFVARRLWLVQFGIGANTDAARAGTLPPRTTVKLVDGATQRALSLVSGANRSLVNDAGLDRASAAYLGLPSPYLIRNNNNLFAEVINPGAAATPWAGDLYLVAEGHKIYPMAPEAFPRTIKAYSIPYGLNSNHTVIQPTLAAGNLNNQIATITNNGEGKFLAKAFSFQAIGADGADYTDRVTPILGFQFVDTTSGTKQWIQNQNADTGPVFCPASILMVNQSFQPWHMPRFVDENGVVQVGINFAASAAALAYAATLSWPMRFTVNLAGSLLPR